MFVRLLLAAALATTLVYAQGGKKGGGGGGMGGMGMGPSQRPSKFEQFADKLKLSTEQKQDVRTILTDAMKEFVPLREQIDQGRVSIAGAMIEGKSADEIKKLSDDYTTLAVQMAGIEAKAFGKIYESLKPNQQSKAGQAFELLVAVLEPAGGVEERVAAEAEEEGSKGDPMFYKLLLTGIFATTLVLAQGRGGGGGMGGGMGGDEGGMGGGGGMGGMQMPKTVTRMDQISEALKLNKDQKKEVKTILDEGQKEALPVRDQLLKSELAIGEAIQAGKSQDDLKPLIGSEGALQAQMAGIELSAFAKIYKLLDQEQTPQTKAVFPMMKGIFNGKNWNNAE